MKIHKTIYSQHAIIDLKRLETKVAKRIIKKIHFYTSQENIFDFAKQLKNLGERKYRFRIGNYRAIFTINSDGSINILMILGIKHRKEIYTAF